MREEDFLMEKVGRHESFRVPDGYFDNLAARVMEQLPEQEHTAVTESMSSQEPRAKVVRPVFGRRLRTMFAAAACLAAIVFGATLFFNDKEQQDPMSAVAFNGPSDDSYTYMDEAADYAMMDNQDIYACLMSE